MPRLTLISDNPNHPTVLVELSEQDEIALNVINKNARPGTAQVSVTLSLDWPMVWRFYRRALKSKGGKAVVGNGILTFKRR